MKKLFILFGLILTSCLVWAQENCTNGIDDDNDGLIDLLDEECGCLTPTGYYFFDDFESNICCPQYFTTANNPYGIECLNGMSPASNATPDYFHTCGYLGGLAGPEPPLVPLPMPSGMAAAGIIAQNSLGEYLGTCLPQPMLAGVEYEVSMYVGFNTNSGFGSESPVQISIYATNDCINYPSPQIFCLSQDPNWYVIGSMTVVGNNGQWVLASTTITPGADVAAIAVGVPCNFVSGSNYYFIDDFQIIGGGIEQIPLEDEITGAGDCVNGITLSSTTFPGADYQWFFNGVAISGANDPTYEVPPGGEGQYQVMITINGECGISNPYEVEIDESVLQIDADVVLISCYNAGDGSINLNLPGTNQPIEVLWSNGETSPTLTGLTQGLYMVTLTDSRGCFGTATYEIFQPDELELILDYVIQPGGNNAQGEAGITIAGGTPDYMIEWSTGGDGYKETGLSPGYYTITVTDTNGCVDTVSFTITAPFQAQVSFVPSTCQACSGNIVVVVNGGIQPIEVTITNLTTGESTIGSTAANLCPTLYSYHIVDGNGNTIGDTLDLGAQAFPQIKTTLLQDTVCVGDSTGVIGVNVTGGNPGYHYKWSTGDTMQMVQKLRAGSYVLTVTDQLGCSDTVAYQIKSAPVMATEVMTSPAGCLTGGNMSQTVTGGTMPYSWLWSTGDTSMTVNNIAAGLYTVVVTDSLGCNKQDTVTVIQQGGIEAAGIASNSHCEEVKDGSINLSPISYNGNVSFLWSNGSTEEDIDSLGAGLYTVTITDEIGCRLVQEYVVGTEAAYQVVANINSNRCNNDSLASITLIVTGGSNYAFEWSDGSNTGTISGLKAGNYNVSITDGYGCEQRHDYILTDPPILESDTDITPVLCAGEANGGIAMTAEGGTGSYTYFINGTETSPNITSLGEGEYELVVRDDNGCADSSIVNVMALSNASVSTQITEAPCGESVGSEIDVTVSGGISPYLYIWNNGSTTEDLSDVVAGNYQVTVTDQLGCKILASVQLTNTNGPTVMVDGIDPSCHGENDGQLIISAQQGSPPYIIYVNGQLVAGEEIKALLAGTYEVRVVDAKGCEIKTNYEIGEPMPVDVEIVGVIQPDINKTTGSANIEVSGGTAPYTIEWDNGEIGLIANELNPGKHSVTITDNNGCTKVAEVTIVKSTIYTTWNKIDNRCAGECVGEIKITIQNVDGTETIEWSDGGIGFERTGLCAGTYQWVIMDAFGNSITSPVVTIITPEPIKLEVELIGESCENRGDGKATIKVDGGVPVYKIEWDGVEGGNTVNLGNGAHLIEVTDANGCSSDTLVQMPRIISASLITEVKDAICETGGELAILTNASEVINVLINGIKYSIDKELTIRPLTPSIYKIEQQINDSCIVIKDEITVGAETFITGGSIETEIEVKEGEEVILDISTLTIAGKYNVKWEGIQQENCLLTDVYGNCLTYAYVPDGPHEVNAHILSEQGCDSLITFNIRVLVDNDVFLPNVFGVGNQQIFKPVDKTGTTVVESFQIWDRWGNLVHQEKNVLISSLLGWNGTIDGQPAEHGVYVYDLIVNNKNGQKKLRTGDVTLIK